MKHDKKLVRPRLLFIVSEWNDDGNAMCRWNCAIRRFITYHMVQKLFLTHFSFPGCATDGFLENSSSIFRNFNFGAFAGPNFWISGKFIQQFFVSTYSVFVKLHIWMSFPEIGLAHTSEI